MILFNILSHFVLVTLHIAEQKVLCGAFLTVAKTVQTLQSRGVLNHRKTPTGFILCYCLLTAAANSGFILLHSKCIHATSMNTI